jgi:dolichyl-phosphate beta-glucosyltransferase
MGSVHTVAETHPRSSSSRSPAAVATSIVVPIYNEMHRLPDVLPELLDLAVPGTELIFVDDGSRDGTGELLSTVTDPNTTTVRLPRNRGKGAAVRAGAGVARGHAIVFMDSDLATATACLEPLVCALDTADLAIGSRAHPQSVIRDASVRRSRLGGRFNRLTRQVTGLEFCDTQCGFKAFRAEAARLIFHLARINRFAFDVELLCLARALGMRVAEVPVDWTERPGSKIRSLRDPLRMALDVMVIRVRNSAHNAPVTLCCVEPIGDDLEYAAHLVRQRVRPCDMVETAQGEVCIYLPGSSRAGAECVLQRMRTILPDAEVHIERASCRQVRQSLERYRCHDHRQLAPAPVPVAFAPPVLRA